MDSMRGLDILNDNYFYKNQLISSSNDFVFKQDENPFLWKELMQLNTNYIKRSKDISPMEPYVDNILLSSLTSNDIATLPEEYILQLVNLLQLFGQYLVYTQNKLQYENENLKQKLLQFNKSINDNERYQKVIKNLTRQNQEKDILIKTYQNMIKGGNINNINNNLIENDKNDYKDDVFEKKVYYCRFCSGKKFKSKEYLEQHLKRRHLIETTIDQNEENDDINYKMKTTKENFDEKLDSMRSYLENIIKQNQTNNDYNKLNQKLDFLQNTLISQNLNATNNSLSIGYYPAFQPQNIPQQNTTITKNTLIERTIKENVNTQKSTSNINYITGLNQIRLQMSQYIDQKNKEYDNKIKELENKVAEYKNKFNELKESSTNKNNDTMINYGPPNSSKKYYKEENNNNISINRSYNMNEIKPENNNTNPSDLRRPNSDGRNNNINNSNINNNNINNNNINNNINNSNINNNINNNNNFNENSIKENNIKEDNIKENNSIKVEQNIKIDDLKPETKLNNINLRVSDRGSGIYSESNEKISPKFSIKKSTNDNNDLKDFYIKFRNRDDSYNGIYNNYLIKTIPLSFEANDVNNYIIKEENDKLPNNFENYDNRQLNGYVGELIDKKEKNLLHKGVYCTYYGKDIEKVLGLNSIIDDYRKLESDLSKMREKKPIIVDIDSSINIKKEPIDNTNIPQPKTEIINTDAQPIIPTKKIKNEINVSSVNYKLDANMQNHNLNNVFNSINQETGGSNPMSQRIVKGYDLKNPSYTGRTMERNLDTNAIKVSQVDSDEFNI